VPVFYETGWCLWQCGRVIISSSPVTDLLELRKQQLHLVEQVNGAKLTEANRIVDNYNFSSVHGIKIYKQIFQWYISRVFDIQPIKKDVLDTQATKKLDWTSKPLSQKFLTPKPFRLGSVRI
jgi:hypothetical protein